MRRKRVNKNRVPQVNKSSAVAEVAHRGHNKHGPNICGDSAPFLGRWGWVPIEHKVPWDEAYLHTKWHLDASSHLATIRVGQKLGALLPFFGGELGPWTKAYLRA